MNRSVDTFLEKKYRSVVDMAMKDSYVKRNADLNVYQSFMSAFTNMIDSGNQVIPLVGFNYFPSDVKEMVHLAISDLDAALRSSKNCTVTVESMHPSYVRTEGASLAPPTLMETLVLTIKPISAF